MRSDQDRPTGVAAQNRGLSTELARSGQASSPYRSGPVQTVESFGAVTTREQSELQALAVSEQKKAMVVGMYTMARANPRREEDARVKIMEVCKRPKFAEKAKYRKPVGGSHIVGPSIRMAEEIGRLWGNLRVEKTALYDDEKKRVVGINVIDLESNISYSAEFTIAKTVERKSSKGREVLSERINSYNEKVSIVVATEDEVMIKENAHASKEIRNLILRCVPEWLKDEAIETVDTVMRQKIKEDPEAAKRTVIDGLAAVGVLPSHVEVYIGHPFAQVTPDELADLQEITNAIREGHTSWTEVTAAPGEKPEPKPKKEATRMDLGDLEGMEPGDPAKHTPVNKPVVGQGQEPDALDDPEAVEATISECAAFLVKSSAGNRALMDSYHHFKVSDHTQVLPMQRAEYARHLIEAVENIKKPKK